MQVVRVAGRGPDPAPPDRPHRLQPRAARALVDRRRARVFEALGGAGFGDPGGLAASDLPAIAICAVVFFVANSTLVRTAEALLQRAPIGAHLLGDLIFRSWSAATLFALGPPVAVIAENWLYLVPVLALPMAAVHRASKQASEMEHLALHDPMTSLPNRTLLLQRTDDALQQAAEQETALLSIGLDRFQDVNDTLGRAQGDGVLIEIGEQAEARGALDGHGRARGGGPLRRAAAGPRRAAPTLPAAAAEKIVEDAQPPDRRGERDAQRGRHRRDRLRPRSRQQRRAAAPARGGGDVPREARAVAPRVLLARARGGGAAPARARDRAEARHRRPRDHAPLPAEDRARARQGGGGGGARALDGPGARSGRSQHLRAARRAHRPRRAAHRARARDGRGRLPALAGPGLLRAGGGERVGAGARGSRAAGAHRRAAARLRPRRRGHRDRDHREHADGRSRAGARRDRAAQPRSA